MDFFLFNSKQISSCMQSHSNEKFPSLFGCLILGLARKPEGIVEIILFLNHSSLIYEVTCHGKNAITAHKIRLTLCILLDPLSRVKFL